MESTEEDESSEDGSLTWDRWESQRDNPLVEKSQVSTRKSHYPLKKWVNSLRSKKSPTSRTPQALVDGWPDELSDGVSDAGLSPFPNFQEQQWDQLSKGSSSILGTVKTASVSIATHSAMRSRTTTQSTHRSPCRSEALSNSEARASIESARLTSITTLDDAVRSRAAKRRQILHELYATEADYVTGLKALTDVMSTILVTRPTIYQNIRKLREMHERFLLQLQIVTPMSQEDIGKEISSLRELQDRWSSSIDLKHLKKSQNRSLRTRNLKATIDSRIRKATAEPLEAVRVAKELSKLSEGFGVYEDYCSKYDLLHEDIDILRKSLSASAFFDRGIEALVRSVASTASRWQEDRKSMTLKDLLIKPVQRVCKYPLLLQDLLKYTPAGDCPLAYHEINQILDMIRLILARIDTATGNRVLKDRIQKTMVLQDRLDYNGQSVLQNVYQQLGPMILCGVLHVAYHSSNKGVTGNYMICILFPGYMVFARGGNDNRKLMIIACLYILDTTIDVLDNGKGLRCQNCPFSWKVNFQDLTNSYELILSASSATEEKHWKMELLRASAAMPCTLPTESLEPRKFFMSTLQARPLDHICFPSALLTRRSSMRSQVSPVNLRLHPEQVVIENTHSPFHHDEGRQTHKGGKIERSHSVTKADSSTLLAPRREDRIKLERDISDIYTRDVLPYPGMVLPKDHLANSIIRKISFPTPFSRRSSSITTGTIKSIRAGSEREDEGSDKEMEEAVTQPTALLQVKEQTPDRKQALDGSPESPRRIPMSGKPIKDGGGKRGSLRKRWGPQIALLSALASNRRGGVRDSSGGG